MDKVADRILFLSHPRSNIEDSSCLLDGLLGKEMFMNEGLQDFLLPPDLKNTIALSLVSYGSFDVCIMHRGATSF